MDITDMSNKNNIYISVPYSLQWQVEVSGTIHQIIETDKNFIIQLVNVSFLRFNNGELNCWRSISEDLKNQMLTLAEQQCKIQSKYNIALPSTPDNVKQVYVVLNKLTQDLHKVDDNNNSDKDKDPLNDYKSYCNKHITIWVKNHQLTIKKTPIIDIIYPKYEVISPIKVTS